jgi:hypothetical protein
LAYVIRPEAVPPGIDPLDLMYTIELHGPQYIQDRSEVYTILERCVIQGPGETYVKEHQSTRNGRMALMDLDRRGTMASTLRQDYRNTIHLIVEGRGRYRNSKTSEYVSVSFAIW